MYQTGDPSRSLQAYPVLFGGGGTMLTKCSARRTSALPLQWHMEHCRLPNCQVKSLLCHLCLPGSNKTRPFALQKLKFIVGCLNLHSIFWLLHNVICLHPLTLWQCLSASKPSHNTQHHDTTSKTWANSFQNWCGHPPKHCVLTCTQKPQPCSRN